ncbi:retrovirus-related Pol polyprotein from transposon opus [Trichonephila clavipes]|nr:retrovirus-related Pol polyprotein from transposon opus [Trichonephila clavipes]
MAFLIRSKKIDLIQLARDLDESPDPSMSKIVLRNLIISSKYYKEEEAKELLEVITTESLERLFASEMVSDELKPKVLLCMLGDKVSNLLVNLGEEELKKDYESLKQVVLKEYEPSPKICLENFRKAKRNSDESFSQFASRLTSMWLYYCKLREANDFESVNQLIVADKMFGMLILRRRPILVCSKGKNGKTSISVDGKLVHALVDSGTEITVIKKYLVPGISVEGSSTIYLKGIFGTAVKCPLVYVPIGLATGDQVNVVHQQVLCALAEVLVEDVLLSPDVLDMLGGTQSEENSLAQKLSGPEG